MGWGLLIIIVPIVIAGFIHDAEQKKKYGKAQIQESDSLFDYLFKDY